MKVYRHVQPRDCAIEVALSTSDRFHVSEREPGGGWRYVGMISRRDLARELHNTTARPAPDARRDEEA